LKNAKSYPYEKRKALLGFTFIIPWLIGCVFFFLLPFIRTLIYSFYDIKIVDDGLAMTFCGLQNYIRTFVSDELFLPTFTSAFYNTVFQVPFILLFSLFIAVVLNQEFRTRTFFRSVFFLPVIISSGVIISLIAGDSYASSLLSGQRSSMMFQAVSIQDLLLKSGVDTSFVNAVIYVVNNIFQLSWKSGVQILVFIAGLKTIPPHLYEVAKTEGANVWETFWLITFRLLSPIILVNVIYTIIDSFTDYMNPMIVYIAKTASNLEIQYSASMAWMYFLCVFAVIAAVFLLMTKKSFSYSD